MVPEDGLFSKLEIKIVNGIKRFLGFSIIPTFAVCQSNRFNEIWTFDLMIWQELSKEHWTPGMESSGRFF